MNAHEVLKKVEDDFSRYLQRIDKEDIPFAEKGREKLWFRIYTTG